MCFLTYEVEIEFLAPSIVPGPREDEATADIERFVFAAGLDALCGLEVEEKPSHERGFPLLWRTDCRSTRSRAVGVRSLGGIVVAVGVAGTSGTDDDDARFTFG